jgi:hypothetical protein
MPAHYIHATAVEGNVTDMQHTCSSYIPDSASCATSMHKSSPVTVAPPEHGRVCTVCLITAWLREHTELQHLDIYMYRGHPPPVPEASPGMLHCV